MSNMVTGPMSNRSYGSLEAGSLNGPVLEASRGNFGLAVAYGDNSFRFEADITDVRREGDICTVDADVTTLDGKMTQKLRVEADRTSGMIAGAALKRSPLTIVGNPREGYFYFPQLSKVPREDENFTSDWDEKLFHQLAEKGQVDVRKVLEGLRIAGVPGTVTSVNRPEDETASRAQHTPRWGLFGGLLPIRRPRY